MSKVLTLRSPQGLALVLGGVLLLAACDDDPVTRRCINTLGADFASAFNRGLFDEPVDAQSVNLKLTPTIEPCVP